MAFINTFRSLHSASPLDANSTANASIAQLPANILEAFIPGYSIISKFLFEQLGFDITLVVSICFLAFGLVTSARYMWAHAYDWFETYFMSFICIDSDDDIYDHIMAWIVEQQVSKHSRSLMAKTGRENAWDTQDGDIDEGEPDPNILLNFSNWDAKVPPRFQPYFGRHRFFHRGRYFVFSREAKQMMYSSTWGGSVFQTDETIKLTCVGRSAQPIKDLIRECRDRYIGKEKACTVVRRPAPKETRSRGRSVWTKVATRPSRPMETVVLEHDQKARVLADINEYLHPSTPTWYARRGIPYRRGYLFEGAPGTGKSSLAWAIAGVFGLDIYCISLVEPTLTEEDLGLLFANLPRRCVVLLEDIDSAGLVKRQDPEEGEKVKETEAPAHIGAEIAKAFKSVQERNEKAKNNPQGISLSGLLNSIDGVASHEGRVLVMTTNFPDKLDEALIRPGRVDMRVSFNLATRSQMRELFIRMYTSDSPKEVSETGKTSSVLDGLRQRANGEFANGHSDTKLDNGIFTPPASPRDITAPVAELAQIAAEFAQRLPENVLTPAEIQGFLLTRKKEPLKALNEVDDWKDKLLAAKAAKSKAAPARSGSMNDQAKTERKVDDLA